MKFPASRSSLLTAIVIAVLLVALPFAAWEFVQTGELYVLSHRFVDEMVARLSGPGRMRFILQPMVAFMVGARDGIRDTRLGNPPFLWGLVFHPAHRRGLLRGAVASVRDLIAVAILLDVAVQFVMFRIVHPGAALLLGPVLIAAPYATSRALTNRFAQWLMRRESATGGAG